MRKLSVLFFVCALVITSVNAQSLAKVEGKITASTKRIHAATVKVLRQSDSALVKMTVSTNTGTFSVSNLQEGDYLLNVTAIGYQQHFTKLKIQRQQSVVSLPAIELVSDPKFLKEVIVTGKKSLIEQKPGKTIVNVDASPSNAGISALDLLEKSPGVSIDKDGNVNLRGKQGVMILIDGKPSYLSGADLVNLLKNMQSSNLEQIEIMTNPPAKYDAAGNAGIINLKTKKSNVKGTNGNASVTYSQGIYARMGSNVSLNHRNNKLNVFGTYGVNRYEGFNNLELLRKFYKADKVTLAGSSDQVSVPHFYGYNQFVKAGADYYLSKKDVVGFVVNGNFNRGAEDPKSESNVRGADANILYSLKSRNENTTKFASITTNVNYKRTIDSTGKELSTDIDYASYFKNSNTLLHTESFDALGNNNASPVSLKGVMPSRIRIYSAKVDYVHPFSKSIKLEAGAKSSMVSTDNKVDYTRSSGTQWINDSRSNHFIYDENINAAYATISTNIKKWNLVAGLRVENTNAKGHQLTNDSSFKRNYTNLFPNVGIGFDASKQHQFNVSYSRRINRPDYDDLNPFTFFLDSLTYGQGNPYLQPQFSHIIEASHTLNRSLTTTINFNQTENVITQLLKQDSEKKITYQTRENVSRMQQIGIALSYNKALTKWWSVNAFANVFNNHYTGFYQADPIDIQFTTVAGNLSNTFTFKNGWGAEVSGFYRGKGADGLLVARKMYAMNAGMTKQVLKNKGTLRIGLRDVFLTQIFSGYAKYSDVDVDLTSRRDTRQFTLSFSYRFGKSNFTPARKRTGGASDEQNRVKGGGNG